MSKLSAHNEYLLKTHWVGVGSSTRVARCRGMHSLQVSQGRVGIRDDKVILSASAHLSAIYCLKLCPTRLLTKTSQVQLDLQPGF